MLDTFEKNNGALPKTILFCLDPSHNQQLATLCGSFSKEATESVVTQGPAWWWCDNYVGMRDMLDSFMSFSVLSTFPGMVTDSRSILSFVRHEYFRRVLCGWIGEKVEADVLPNDVELLSELVKKMCYENAKNIEK